MIAFSDEKSICEIERPYSTSEWFVVCEHASSYIPDAYEALGLSEQQLHVRQALNLAVDIDLIHEKVMRGKSRNPRLLVAPPVPGYDSALDIREPADPERAKTLLADAGYADGFEVGFDCPNDQ